MTPDDIKALAESAKAARRYAGVIVGPALEQLGGMLTDTVGFWRLKNQVNLMLKAKKFLEAKRISPQKMLPSVFVPLLEEAGNTDDPDISEMFARLLATQLDPDRRPSVHPSFAKVLGQLSPLDAKLLRLVDDHERSNPKPMFGPRHGLFTLNDHLELFKDETGPSVEPAEVSLSLQNLMRLGLCEDKQFEDAIPTVDVYYKGTIITDFGVQFLLACSDGKYWRRPQEEKKWKDVSQSIDRARRPNS